MINKWIFLSMMASVAYAGDHKTDSANTTQTTPSENGQTETKSTVDRVIDVIAEAAITSPEYGKDLADR
jgi:hypothetical protein